MNYVAYLIDSGFDYKDKTMIKKGISRGETLVKNNGDSFNAARLSKLLYFIGNGYANLFALELSKENGFQHILDNGNLQKAKNKSRESIENSEKVSRGLKKRLWTNYANCLDSLGRTMDALFAYEEVLKVDPNFSMAIANKAMAMRFFADVSGNYRGAVYNNAYKMLKSVKDQEDLILVGGSYAKICVENEIKYIESIMSKETLEKDLNHKPYDLSKMSPFEKFYVEFCTENSLFLNFHIHEDVCEASISDPIFIMLSLPLYDRKTFYNLSKTLNQIKEDYVVARLFLVQSQYKTEDLNDINQRTTFANTPDYTLSNIYIGLLKSAFKEVYNILDKIARFVNEYFWLGIPDNKNIYITSKELWKDKLSKNNWKMKLEVEESKNFSLYALYDISLDLEPKKGYYDNLRQMRNKLVHEKLVIHTSDWNGKEDNYNIKYDKMLSRTIKLFKIVKSSIIYLINAVEIEERKKRRETIVWQMKLEIL